MFSSAFIKGHSHLKCDDYAMHAQDCAFLSDGCSAVFHSDIGAKILPYTAIEHVEFFKNSKKTDTNVDVNSYLTILRLILNKSIFNKNLFACTLGGIVKKHDASHFFLLGDGIVYIEEDDGIKRFYKVSYSQNILFYFQYFMNKDDLLAWQGFTENKRNVEANFLTDGKESYNIPNNNYLFFSGYIHDNFKTIAIFSDGPEQVDNLTTKEAITQLTDFKNFNTDFAWRRLKRFEETQKKVGNNCQDDISMIVWRRD